MVTGAGGLEQVDGETGKRKTENALARAERRGQGAVPIWKRMGRRRSCDVLGKLLQGNVDFFIQKGYD